jgi:hypothetical protein
MLMYTRIAALAVFAALVAGCSAPAGDGADLADPPAHRTKGLRIVAATADGAVVLDLDAATYTGIDRAGSRIWTETEQARQGAAVQCLTRCPQAVLSGAGSSSGRSPAPMLFTSATAAPFTTSSAYRQQVLTARSATDAVVEETDERGRSGLRILRGGGEQRIELPEPEPVWAESPDGSVALSFPRSDAVAQPVLRWFVRDADGWRLADDKDARGQAWGACVADGGQFAILAGGEPSVVLDRKRHVPVHTDLKAVSECGIGRQGGVVLERAASSDGQFRTAVRGIGLDGAQSWARDYDTEAVVTVDPSGRHTAIAHDGEMEVLDLAGKTVRTEPGTAAARFTPDGELMTATTSGAFRWLSL